MCRESLVDTRNESGWIEFGAENFIGTIREHGHTPIADKSNNLAMTNRLDLGTKAFGLVHLPLAFYVHENEVEGTLREERKRFMKVTCRLDRVTGEPHDLISKRTNNLTLADMQNRFLQVRRFVRVKA